MLDESLLSNKYKRFKQAVVNKLLDAGLNVENNLHTIESWVRDYYIDGYTVDDCVAACKSYIKESKEKTMTFEERIKLAEAKRVARENGYNVIRESKQDSELDEALAILKKSGYNVEAMNEATMKRKYQQDSYARGYNTTQKTEISKAFWDLFSPDASKINALMKKGIEKMKEDLMDRVDSTNLSADTKKTTKNIIQKFKHIENLWNWAWVQTGEGEGGRRVQFVKPTDPAYRPHA